MEGKGQQAAAAASGMSVRTARTWQRGRLPSERKGKRRWRTRPDPFAGVWAEEVEPLLRSDVEGALKATTILEWRVASTVRDLSALGPIVDDVAEAGGDFTRINGVSFTVEDTKPFMNDLREAAFEEAEAKAGQLADLAGVELGQAMFISEGVATPDVVRSNLAFRAVAMESSATPISAGETELRLTISALFGIEK